MLSQCKWPSDFVEQFWQVYPRKVSKNDAIKALQQIKKNGEVPFEILLSGAIMYAKSIVGKEMKYVAFPATWLRAGRWDDNEDALSERYRVQPTAMRLASGHVLIKRFSPQAAAWKQFRGRDFPWGKHGVWMVESEWPPGETK